MATKKPEQQERKRGSAATQFKPGVSGNPGGRPKGSSFLALMREMGGSPLPQEAEALRKRMPKEWQQDEISWKKAVVFNLYSTAIQRTHLGMQAAKFVIEMEDGKPTQRIEGAEGGAIEVKYDYNQLPTEDLKAIIERLEKAKVKK